MRDNAAHAGGRRARDLAAALLLTGGLVSAGASAAHGAIINSLGAIAEAQPGWAGTLEGSWGASGGNTEESTLAAAARVQWHGDRDVWRLLGAANRTSSQGRETARAVLGHLRHNHRLGARWSTLAFAQVQENPFQRLSLRVLTGAGMRCDALRAERATVSLGAAYMWEREQLEDADERTTATRLSSFVTLRAEARDGVELDVSAFYQPRWTEFDDWRAFVQAELGVELAASLELFTGWQLEHDARPPDGVEATDWSTTTGFRVAF